MTSTRRIESSNLMVGAAVSMFEVTTLGQPLEVLKTHMAAHRDSGLKGAIRDVWYRGASGGGGIRGFYQGLIPWAWIESSSAGAILLFTAAELESFSVNNLKLSPSAAGFIGGCGGGVAQAYLTMGVCTTMKTAEITRAKQSVHTSAAGTSSKGTMGLFIDILRKEGIQGINKGVHAVALRQCTNWGSRMGFTRLAEDTIRKARGRPKGFELTATDKVTSSVIGGALGCWNHPIEVVRIEMQSMAKHSTNRPQKMTIMNTMSYIYKEHGLKGLFKGVLPRMGLSVWRTVCFVSVADMARAWWRDRV
ncbi:hypothetical protein PCANC_01836 [Puccinia coronata f. sp. avenae]|uniref:Mitochondrial carrier protein n=1 Tax=Puccinia coronata f. sp. avenae TaxID=200324 RepID=A0A2N5T8P3_9BASI|nr:hypothetical protein PCASD_17120 [Puccinia coronata f. sp. avenae]PLW21862.1 hypothetical protein PCANC_03371 [Puccinia coronata f. sp. avenae]PLW39608.1 hypothetical protein PCASD_08796 [Puccinia coronata f. sp. avenae]PLW57429.1 hypothetical protein PCANC_01836 [Puccinia coronata f. sp. avenae]